MDILFREKDLVRREGIPAFYRPEAPFSARNVFYEDALAQVVGSRIPKLEDLYGLEYAQADTA